MWGRGMVPLQARPRPSGDQPLGAFQTLRVQLPYSAVLPLYEGPLQQTKAKMSITHREVRKSSGPGYVGYPPTSGGEGGYKTITRAWGEG